MTVARVTTLAVPTRGRTAALRRCLRSYAANLAAHGRDTRLVLFDDSDEPVVRAANLDVLRRVAREAGVAAWYSGPDDRLRAARALARATGAPPRLLEFALTNPRRGVAPGGQRNALLLETAGQSCVTVDDDTRCAVGRSPDALLGVATATTADFEASFLPRDWRHRPPVAFADMDLVGLHEDRLGCAVPSAAGRPARVVTSALGYVGDSGMDSPALHLLLPPPALARLFVEVEHHGRIWRTGQLLRVAPRETIATRGVCMAGCLGLDNRDGLPPFLPVLRNEDGVFGRLLDAAFPDARIAMLPWVLDHRRPGRARPAVDGPPLGVAGAGEILGMLVGTWPGSLRNDWRERLPAIGQQLLTLAARPASLFQLLVDTQRRACSLLERMLERRLAEQTNAPRAWREDLVRQLAGLRRTRTRPESALPHDLGTGAGRPTLRRLTALLENTGELLAAWPALWAQAARGAPLHIALPVEGATGRATRNSRRRAR
jgi:hypothetical protein